MNERIKQLRKQLGLTQAEFGSKIGVKQTSVAGYETGARVPIDAVVASICREFNVSEAWLRFGSGEMYVKRTMNQELALMVNALMSEADESFRKRFMTALLELPPQFWPELERFVKKIAQDDAQDAKSQDSETRPNP